MAVQDGIPVRIDLFPVVNEIPLPISLSAFQRLDITEILFKRTVNSQVSHLSCYVSITAQCELLCYHMDDDIFPRVTSSQVS